MATYGNLRSASPYGNIGLPTATEQGIYSLLAWPIVVPMGFAITGLASSAWVVVPLFWGTTAGLAFLGLLALSAGIVGRMKRGLQLEPIAPLHEQISVAVGLASFAAAFLGAQVHSLPRLSIRLAAVPV
jgi:hypothetical protein